MPDRNDRNPQKFENLEPRQSDGYSATGAWGWWWVWFIILVCAFIWFAGWGWGSHGGWWWGNRRVAERFGAATGQSYNGPVGTPVGNGQPAEAPVLVANNKREFEGRPLQVSEAPVLEKVNNDVFWVGSNSSSPLLVVVNPAGNSAPAANVSPGESVNLTGTVEKAPAADQAKKEWGLDNAGAQKLEQEGAYLSANRASKAR